MSLLGRRRKYVPADAYGVMFLEGNQMTPVVYVESTASMVWESSCQVAAWKLLYICLMDADTGEFVYELYQRAA